MVFALVDGVIGPTELDQQVLGELEENGIPFTVVATKLDKVKPSQLETRKRDLARGCGLAQDDIVWVSATTGIGIVKLRASVGNYLNGKNANKKR
jgi:GTP-binding protein